jgi:hypothetical protein
MKAVYGPDWQAAQTAIVPTTVYEHRPVYVVQVTGGTFTAQRHPFGTAPRHGNVLVVVVDAETYDIRSLAYVSTARDLTQIGQEIVDLPDLSGDAGTN